MSSLRRKLRRILPAACAALLLVISISGIDLSAVTAQPTAPWQDYFRQAGVSFGKTDMGGTLSGKTMFKPAKRVSGGRGTDLLACLKALAAGSFVYYPTEFIFVIQYDKQNIFLSLSLAAHGCRAPPASFPHI